MTFSRLYFLRLCGGVFSLSKGFPFDTGDKLRKSLVKNGSEMYVEYACNFAGVLTF